MCIVDVYGLIFNNGLAIQQKLKHRALPEEDSQSTVLLLSVFRHAPKQGKNRPMDSYDLTRIAIQ